MINETKLGLLAAMLGLTFAAGDARAAVIDHYFDSNAVNHCQAFTPGVTNTIRNRVVGSENVGTATINVACDFGSMWNGADGNSNPTSLQIFFSNTSTAPITINCTLLTGWQGSSAVYVVTKSVVVPASTTSDAGYNLMWTAADNPTPEAEDMGDALIGINCAVPHGGVLNDTYLSWNMDNGVGS